MSATIESCKDASMIPVLSLLPSGGILDRSAKVDSQQGKLDAAAFWIAASIH